MQSQIKKIIITQLLYNIKKVPTIYFLFTVWKTNYITKKEKKNSRGKKIKNFQIFLKAFFKYKNKCAFNKKIQPKLKWKKLSITQLFYKKSHQFISFIPYEKKWSNYLFLIVNSTSSFGTFFIVFIISLYHSTFLESLAI